MSERRMQRWVRAGDAVSDEFRRRIAEATERAQQRRVENHERYGWPLDAECDWCGDTGWDASGEACTCNAGVRHRDELRKRLARERYWTESSSVPKRFQGYGLDGHPNAAAAATVRTWVDARASDNLYLHGPIGTGKTGLAIGALRLLVERGEYPVRFWSVPDLLDAMRPGATPPDPMDEVKAVPWLVLDDLGVERPSDWVRERLYVLINGRYEAALPTIVTSNCDLFALAEALGDRTVSRFAESVTVVAVDGDDLRRRG